MGREKKIEAEREALLPSITIGDCDKPKFPKKDIDEGKNYIFISYSHDDYKRVYSDLISLYYNGVRFWYDEGLPCDDKWYESVEKHLTCENCSGVIFYTSRSFFESESIFREINDVYNKKNYICVNLTEEMHLALLDAALPEIRRQHRRDRFDMLEEMFDDDKTFLRFSNKNHDQKLLDEIKTKFNVVEERKSLHGEAFFDLAFSFVKERDAVLLSSLEEKFGDFVRAGVEELIDEGIVYQESKDAYKALIGLDEWIQFLWENYESKRFDSEKLPEEYFYGYNAYFCKKLLPLVMGSEGTKVRHKDFGNGIVTSILKDDKVEIDFEQSGKKTIKLESSTIQCNCLQVDFRTSSKVQEWQEEMKRIRHIHNKRFFNLVHRCFLEHFLYNSLNSFDEDVLTTLSSLQQEFSGFSEADLEMLIDEKIVCKVSGETYKVLFDLKDWENFLWDNYESKRFDSEKFPEEYFTGYNDYLYKNYLMKPRGKRARHKSFGNGIIMSNLKDGNVEIYFEGNRTKIINLKNEIDRNCLQVDCMLSGEESMFFPVTGELESKIYECDVMDLCDEIAAEEKFYKEMKAEAKMDFEEEEQYSESEFMTEWEEWQREEAEERNWMRDEIEEWNSDREGEGVLMGDFVPYTTYDEEDMSDFDIDDDMPY